MSYSIFARLGLTRFASRKSKPDAEQVLHEIFTETSAKLFASLRRMLEPAQAEEVLQEAFLRLFVALKEERAPEPRPFLFRVARNLAISHLRHQKVVEQHGTQAEMTATESDPQREVEQQVSREQEQAALVAAINALPVKCRQVFVMRKIDGLSHEQIAQILEISTKTVENHLARGMRLCREHLVSDTAAATTPAATNTAPATTEVTMEKRLATG